MFKLKQIKCKNYDDRRNKKRKSIGKYKLKNDKKYNNSQENYLVELNEDILELACFSEIEYFVPFTSDLKSYYLSFKNINDESVSDELLSDLIESAINRDVKRHFNLMDIIYKKYNFNNDHIFIKYLDNRLFNKVKIEMYDQNCYENNFLKVGNKFGFPRLGPGGTIDKCDISTNEDELIIINENELEIYEVKNQEEFDKITFNTAIRELEEETGLKYISGNTFTITDHYGIDYNYKAIEFLFYEKKREKQFMRILQIFFPDNAVLELKRIFINKKRFQTDTYIEVTSFL
jgi:hypothetical protein